MTSIQIPTDAFVRTEIEDEANRQMKKGTGWNKIVEKHIGSAWDMKR